MKQVLVVAVLFCAAANDALAQGLEVHTRFGASGSHVTLSPDAPTFGYEATVIGATAPYEVKLEVFHNGALSFSDSKQVPIPVEPYTYSCPVPTGALRLCTGDIVTFVFTVIDKATGATLATHTLIGVVAGP
ncbi:MAG TPA: hypothetical protein VFC90_07015 [Planctomycetota bacterium]|nr:hypothetical protein [Planctomycetota bacterium]